MKKKKITFKTHIKDINRRSAKRGEGGVRLKTKVRKCGQRSLLLGAKYEVFASGPQGQIGHIQVPQGTVKAGDCDCAAN